MGKSLNSLKQPRSIHFTLSPCPESRMCFLTPRWHSYPYNPSLHSSRMIFPGHRSGNDRLLLKCPPCPQVSVLRMCTRVRCPPPTRLPSLLSYHSPSLTILEPHLPPSCFSKCMGSSHVCTRCPLHVKHSPTQFFTWLAPSYPSLHSEFFADHTFKVICSSVIAIFQHFLKSVCAYYMTPLVRLSST